MQDKYYRAFNLIDTANSEDPNFEVYNEISYPKELLYAKRMSTWQEKLAPGATEALKLAVRCQHIRRWEIARESYPKTRSGYLKWRTDLGKFHAEAAGKILAKAGYDAGLISRVQALIKKENLRNDPEAQLLEDAACLVFLENYFEAFRQKHDEEKMLGIVRKTWRKMSAQAHTEALKLSFSQEGKALLEKALQKLD
jgi:hypothetical protein